MKKVLFFLMTLSFCQVFGFNNNITEPKIIILASKPGSGKGTFSQMLVEMDKRYVHIDAGDLLRSEIRNQSELGKKLQYIYESGKYLDGSLDKIVWDELVCKQLEEYLKQKGTIVILDSCLRTKNSYEITDKFLKDNNLVKDATVLQFKASNETCMKRILNRLICPKCSKIYNRSFYNSEECCGTKLEVRKSDTEKHTNDRFELFKKEVLPILDTVKQSYNYQEIDTECSIIELKEKYLQMFCQNNNKSEAEFIIAQ